MGTSEATDGIHNHASAQDNKLITNIRIQIVRCRLTRSVLLGEEEYLTNRSSFMSSCKKHAQMTFGQQSQVKYVTSQSMGLSWLTVDYALYGSSLKS